VAYRHGLRASELCDLQWHQIELDQGRIHIGLRTALQASIPFGDEIRALRKLRRENATAYVYSRDVT
jgi:integrase